MNINGYKNLYVDRYDKQPLSYCGKENVPIICKMKMNSEMDPEILAKSFMLIVYINNVFQNLQVHWVF